MVILQAGVSMEFAFKDLIENLSEVVFSLDQRDRIVYINPQIEVSSGYSPGELMQRDFSCLICPDHHEKWREVSRELSSGSGKSINIELCLLHKSRESSWIRISAGRWLSDGAYAGILGLMHDITAQKAAEEALKASEERYRAVWENSPIGISLTDRDGIYRYVNPAYCTMYGYSEQELIGKAFFRIISTAGDWETARRRNQGIFAAGKAIPLGETRFVRKNGEVLWVEYTGDFVRKDGIPSYLVSMNVDITYRKKTEEALKASEGNFRLLVENSGDLIAMVDFDGKVLLLNPTAKKSFGVELSDNSPKSLSDIFVKSEVEDRLRAVREVLTRNKSLIREIPITIKGNTRWFSSHLHPIPDMGSGLKAVQIVARDVTEEKRQMQRSLARMRFLDDLRKTSDVEGCLGYICEAVLRAGIYKYSCFRMTSGGLYAWRADDSQLVPYTGAEIFAKIDPGIPDPATLSGGIKIGQSFLVKVGKVKAEEEGTAGEIEGASTKIPEISEMLHIPAFSEDNSYLGWLSVCCALDKDTSNKEIVGYLEELVDLATQHIREIDSRERLAAERLEIEKKNIALSEVLESIEEEKLDLKSKIVNDLDSTILPLVKNIVSSEGSISPVQLKMLQRNIENLADHHGGTARNISRLTSRELEVCELIKAGSSSQEIANTLKIELATVKKHRESIRKKLGLQHKDVNLTTYLISL